MGKEENLMELPELSIFLFLPLLHLFCFRRACGLEQICEHLSQKELCLLCLVNCEMVVTERVRLRTKTVRDPPLSLPLPLPLPLPPLKKLLQTIE